MIALALSLLTLAPQVPEEVLKVNGPKPATLRLGDTSVVQLVIETWQTLPEATSSASWFW